EGGEHGGEDRPETTRAFLRHRFSSLMKLAACQEHLSGIADRPRSGRVARPRWLLAFATGAPRCLRGGRILAAAEARCPGCAVWTGNGEEAPVPQGQQGRLRGLKKARGGLYTRGLE